MFTSKNLDLVVLCRAEDVNTPAINVMSRSQSQRVIGSGSSDEFEDTFIQSEQNFDEMWSASVGKSQRHQLMPPSSLSTGSASSLAKVDLGKPLPRKSLSPLDVAEVDGGVRQSSTSFGSKSGRSVSGSRFVKTAPR